MHGAHNKQTTTKELVNLSRDEALRLIANHQASAARRAQQAAAQRGKERRTADLLQRSVDLRQRKRADMNRRNHELSIQILEEFAAWARRKGYKPAKLHKKERGWTIIRDYLYREIPPFPETVRFDREGRYAHSLCYTTSGKVILLVIVGRHKLLERLSAQQVGAADWHTIGEFGDPNKIAEAVARIMDSHDE